VPDARLGQQPAPRLTALGKESFFSLHKKTGYIPAQEKKRKTRYIEVFGIYLPSFTELLTTS